MQRSLGSLATIAGYLGLIALILAAVGRVFGETDRPFLGLRMVNLYMGGIGMIVWGIWARLEARAKS